MKVLYLLFLTLIATILLIVLLNKQSHPALDDNPTSYFVHKYSHAVSPKGFHCWYEVNEKQPSGVEKICQKN